jgi:Ca2+-binding RTX toxin-like protein
MRRLRPLLGLAMVAGLVLVAPGVAVGDRGTHHHHGGPHCNGLRATIVGTPGNNHLRGTNGPDVIVGRGGRDVIDALRGDDVVCAGPGADVVEAGPGNDVVLGGPGRDDLTGAWGSDMIRDPGGKNLIVDTTRFGETGAVATGSGRDRVVMNGTGSYTVSTGAGHDLIELSNTVQAADVHAGDDGDRLTLGGPDYASAVRANLGAGDDSLWCYESCGGPTVSGGAGANTFHLRAADGPAEVTLGSDGSVVEQTPDEVATLALLGFSRTVLGAEADTVHGSDGDDFVRAGRGDDDIDGGPGDDGVNGGPGLDTCVNVELAISCELP